MNRAERIYRIHALLRPGRPVSVERMQRELEASRATIVRDLGYMRDFMGAPIFYDRELKGHRYDSKAEDFELPGLWFNASELYALLATEQLLESVRPGLLGPQIGPLKSRIRRLLEESGHPAGLVSDRIRLAPFGLRRVDEEIFGRVCEALLGSRRLDIDYHGRSRGETTSRRVHPLRLLHYRDNWYLAAWCERVNGLRTFSLDRIRRAEPRQDGIRDVDGRELDRHLGAGFGIFSGEAKAWAVLRFNPERARWVADELWHPDQIGHFDGTTYELQVPYSDPRELLMDILKYGPDVEVVAPESLRELVATRIGESAARYGVVNQ